MPSASDTAFQLHNTLTRQLEAVEPAEHDGDGAPHLRFYACGPTVYTYAHIGNFRSFLTADLILRTAQAIGWKTTYVSNVTDVGHLTEDDYADAAGEDKMTQALRSKEGEHFANIWDLARYYTAALLADWHALGLHEPDVRPRAAEHITQQIEAIEKLLEKDLAYTTESGVYFAVERFPEYGKLSGKGQDAEALAGTREVVQDPEKRDRRDFALWKKDAKHLMQWYSPFGRGFPGWHLECSVMAMTYLGETIDLHAGGEDLIFPHHECEIAQSESLTGRPFARYWVHTRFLQVEGEKMSKSTGNFLTVRDLIGPKDEGGRGIDPLALRYALISGQYRKPFNFTQKNLQDSAKAVARFAAAQEAVAAALEKDADGEDRVGERLEAIYERTLAAMLDDLNTPVALAAALEGAKLVQGMGAGLNAASARSAQAWLDQINDLLGIVRHEQPQTSEGGEAEDDALAEQVEALLAEREAARKEKDFARADAIRDEIEALGVEVMDSAEGTTWRRKTSFD